MDARVSPFLKRSIRAFNLAHMTVIGDNVHVDWKDLRSNTFEFVVAVYITDDKTTVLIELKDAT